MIKIYEFEMINWIKHTWFNSLSDDKYSCECFSTSWILAWLIVLSGKWFIGHNYSCCRTNQFDWIELNNINEKRGLIMLMPNNIQLQIIFALFCSSSKTICPVTSLIWSSGTGPLSTT